MRIGILVLVGLLGSGLGWGDLMPVEERAEEVQQGVPGGGVSGKDAPLVRGGKGEANDAAERMSLTDMRTAQCS